MNIDIDKISEIIYLTNIFGKKKYENNEFGEVYFLHYNRANLVADMYENESFWELILNLTNFFKNGC